MRNISLLLLHKSN